MPMQKLLICFALSMFFLGASINVDCDLARASDGSPQRADKNSSSGAASRHPTEDNTRSDLYKANCVVCPGLRATGGMVLDWRAIQCFRTSRHSGESCQKATHDAAFTKRFDGATDCRFQAWLKTLP